ncbi:MAG TPA: Ig-like domain-containing protein [Bacteroidales bacterium]|nr:Ig-like domain-containing protein [Bacteroidales bacterium]
MKRKIVILNVMILAVALMIGAVGCKKKSETTTFSLTSLKAGAIDLNAAVPPTNVPANSAITATFNLDVDATTANTNTITLTQAYDTSLVTITVTTNGAAITITPSGNLGNGSQYTLVINGVKSTDGQGLSMITKYFTTVGTFVPAGAVAYWNFEGNANDQVGTLNGTPTNINYVSSFNAAAGQAADFDGTTSIIEVPGADVLLNTNSFTLAFWVHAVSGLTDTSGNSKGQFVMGLGAFHGFEYEIDGAYSTCKMAASYNVNDTATNTDLWFSADGNLGYVGWTFCRDLRDLGGLAALVKDQWANVVCRYNADTKVGTMYINGQKEKEQDFNLYAGSPLMRASGMEWNSAQTECEDILAFGFIKSKSSTLWNDTPWGAYDKPYANHFHGQLDEVRIWHKALTENEIVSMYNSIKP